MKKVIKNLIFTVVLFFALNVALTGNSAANTSISETLDSQKLDLVIVRTVENNVTFINIYTDSGILIMKVAEL